MAAPTWELKRSLRKAIYVDPASVWLKAGRTARTAAKPALISLAVTAVLAAGVFTYFYYHYSQIVAERVSSGFWHSRGGVYAAPRQLHVGSRASIDSIETSLKRSGYLDGQTTDTVFNGSFARDGNVLRIRSRNFATGPDETAEIRFAGDTVASIKIGTKAVKDYVIEPELLIGRTESKRSGNSVLAFEDIPAHLRNAIIAAEDQRFFSHYGIDPRGIARAFLRNLDEGEVTQGGSTITQQLAKNTFLSPERSYTRKFKEAFLALAMESHLTKEEIFALYCNEIYLGQYGSAGIHGVRQAAEMYFGKELAELDLNESAAIAAMIKNPNRFGPHKNAEASRERRKHILEKLARSGNVTEDEAETAMHRPLKLEEPKPGVRTLAPYFVDSATKAIDRAFAGDYFNTNLNTRVYTTVDTQMQRMAEQAIAEQLAKLDRIYSRKGKKLEASIVALDPQTGKVLAMVGGRSYAESQFNRATDALRQPGSTFKPIVYTTALERGYTPISTFADRPVEFLHASVKPYKPSNFRDGYSMKNLTLKTALARSSNVVAVQTGVAVGLENVAATARKFGFENVNAYPSMPLGTVEVTPLQLAAAYASFANGGRRVVPTFIDTIVSGDGRTLYTPQPITDRVINERTAYMITDMLEAVVERGTARSANNALGKDVVFAGKTGSSKDGWFAGYTPDLVTVAWIGFDDNTDVQSTGGEIALPLWTAFMQDVIKAMPEYGGSEFAMPEGLVEMVVDPESGMLADKYCPHSERVVLPRSAASNVKCLLHQPRPDVLLASADGIEELDEPLITDIPAEPPVEFDEPHIPSSTYLDESERGRKRPSPAKPARNEPKEVEIDPDDDNDQG